MSLGLVVEVEMLVGCAAACRAELFVPHAVSASGWERKFTDGCFAEPHAVQRIQWAIHRATAHP